VPVDFEPPVAASAAPASMVLLLVLMELEEQATIDESKATMDGSAVRMAGPEPF
jgi:hypothetical protein